MKNRHIGLRFDAACMEYELFIRREYLRWLDAAGYGFCPVAEAPDTLRSMVRAVRDGPLAGFYPVWEGGSENTIFTEPYVNYMFRYLHDHEHARHSLDTSVEDELTLAALWQGKLCSAGLSADAKLVALLDTAGQTEYFRQRGKFPDNQRSFVREEFINRVRVTRSK